MYFIAFYCAFCIILFRTSLLICLLCIVICICTFTRTVILLFDFHMLFFPFTYTPDYLSLDITYVSIDVSISILFARITPLTNLCLPSCVSAHPSIYFRAFRRILRSFELVYFLMRIMRSDCYGLVTLLILWEDWVNYLQAL